MNLLEWSLHALVSPSSYCVMSVFLGKDFTPLPFWVLTSVWLVASTLGGFHGSCQWTGAQVLPTLCSALPQAEVSKLTKEPNLVFHQSLYIKLYWDAPTAMNWHITYDCFCATNEALSSTWERPCGPQYLEKVLSNLLILGLKIRCRERGSPPKATWGGRDHNCSTVGKFRTRKHKMRVRKLPVEWRRWSRSWTVGIQASAVVYNNLSNTTGSCPWSYVFLITGITWNPPVKGNVLGLWYYSLSPYSSAVMAGYSLQTKLPFEIWPYISVLTQNWVMRFLYFQLPEPPHSFESAVWSIPKEATPLQVSAFPISVIERATRRQSMKSSPVDPRILLCKESSGLGATHFLYISDSISTKSLSVWSQLCDKPFPELLHRTVCWPGIFAAGWLFTVAQDCLHPDGHHFQLTQGILWTGSSPGSCSFPSLSFGVACLGKLS